MGPCNESGEKLFLYQLIFFTAIRYLETKSSLFLAIQNYFDKRYLDLHYLYEQRGSTKNNNCTKH